MFHPMRVAMRVARQQQTLQHHRSARQQLRLPHQLCAELRNANVCEMFPTRHPFRKNAQIVPRFVRANWTLYIINCHPKFVSGFDFLRVSTQKELVCVCVCNHLFAVNKYTLVPSLLNQTTIWLFAARKKINKKTHIYRNI